MPELQNMMSKLTLAQKRLILVGPELRRITAGRNVAAGAHVLLPFHHSFDIASHSSVRPSASSCCTCLAAYFPAIYVPAPELCSSLHLCVPLHKCLVTEKLSFECFIFTCAWHLPFCVIETPLVWQYVFVAHSSSITPGMPSPQHIHRKSHHPTTLSPLIR